MRKMLKTPKIEFISIRKDSTNIMFAGFKKTYQLYLVVLIELQLKSMIE